MNLRVVGRRGCRGMRRPGSAGVLCLLVLLCARLHGASAGRQPIPPLFPVRIEHDFGDPEKTFREVMDLVKAQYYTDDVDDRTLWWAALKGILYHLSPEENRALATIWLPDQFEAVNDSLHGLRESIGVKCSFHPADGALTVTDVIPGGPSESLLAPLDRIVRIDGKALKGMPVAEVSALLQGEPGTAVTLKVVRDVAVFDIDIPREKFHLQTVEGEMFPRDIAYLSVHSFAAGVTEAAREKLSDFRRDGAGRLILDLRGNGGGVLQEGLRFTELFVAKGRPLMRVVTHGEKVSCYVSANEAPLRFDLAVLVDARTASAGEIVAAALRDEMAATLVGTPTYGKATMERIFTLDSQCRVKFTTGAIYSPAGRSWQKKGLTPHIQVDMDPQKLDRVRDLAFDIRLLNDPQLRAAHLFLTGPRKRPEVNEPEVSLPDRNDATEPVPDE
ncbi:MAG: PDZ domain-containing protein [Lentisphaeria bacterium]|nr:PDZ domain-containing protein [Lentisphaeria bacterium]